ncbi:MAG TPA: GH3 auxin-responsive promoter family protein [Polyangiaceae bacterium]|jgi:hypothetical protein
MLGLLVHAWLRRTQRRADAADGSPRAAQEALHRRMAQAIRGTRAAAIQDPRVWEGLEGYRRHLRPTSYDDYRALVEEARSSPVPGTFERRVTTAFGHSSSGKKFVPFTRAHIDTFRAFQMDSVAELAIGQGMGELLGATSLMIQGSLEVARSDAGVLSGYSSAVMVERTPWLLKRRLLPSPEALRSPDPEARAAAIGRALIEKKPTLLTGMPEFVVGMLQQLLAGPDRDRVRDALRGIRAYAWSGMSVGAYRPFLDEHLGPGCRYFDVVSATEGPLGIQSGALGVYRPALGRSLLLFAPPHDLDDRRFAWELEEGATYTVLLGSFAGLHGFRVGDRIRVVQARPLRFELLPRTIDVGATCALLGEDTSDLCAYLDPRTRVLRLLVEGVRPPSLAALRAFTARLGAVEASVRLVERGRIARAAVLLNLQGITKLPRLHSRPEVQALLERLA